ncbi:MAG: hypothetical protein ACC630_07075 [Nitrospinota bacterium]
MKHIKYLTIMLITIFLSLSAFCLAEEAIKLPDSPMNGLTIFLEKRCIRCHSLQSDEKTFGPDLIKSLKNDDIFRIYGKLWSHSPQMFKYMEKKDISHPIFKRDEMKAVLDFLYFLNFFTEKGDVESGRAFFTNSICSKCHAIGRHGKRDGISLDKYKIYMSPIYLATSLWNHGLDMKFQLSAGKYGWPELKGSDLSSLSQFIVDFATEKDTRRVYSLSGSPVKGKMVFEDIGCLSCHKKNVYYDKRQKSALDIASDMWKGGPKMWTAMKSGGMKIPEFTADEFVDLVAYLYFINYPGREGDEDSGKEVFDNNCSRCHDNGPGPALKEIRGRHDYLDLMTTMWNHSEDMLNVAKEKGVTWPRFLGHDMNDLLKFLVKDNR